MNTTKKYLLLIFSVLLTISCDQEAYFELERPNEFPWVNVNELEIGVRETYLLLNRGPLVSCFWVRLLSNFMIRYRCVSPSICRASASAAYYNRELVKQHLLMKWKGLLSNCMND